MHLYLCALKFYKTAIFSSKRTFTGFVPWLITPLDRTTFLSGIFAGEIVESLEKSFWLEGLRKLPLNKLEEYINIQRPEEISNRKVSIFEEIEKVKCIAKKIEPGKYQIKVGSTPKYMRDFTLEHQEDISIQYKKMIFKLVGDIKIEDFASNTYQVNRMKQRLSFVSKVLGDKYGV